MDKPQRFDSRNALSWTRSDEGPEALRRWHLDLFTPRGWYTLGAGAGLVALAYVLGRHELMALGVGLAALAVSSWLIVLRARRTTSLRRALHSPAATVGEAALVTLECPDEVRLRETLPEGFGPGPELAGPGAVDYELVFRSRGIHLLGPARQVISDPLGLIRGMVSIGQPQPVPVRAQIHPLSRFASLGERMLTGDARFSRSTTADYYDVATRDYQQGDSIRQVHWKATARHGKLMVRQENHVATAQALMVLDRTGEHWQSGGADLRVGIPQGLGPELASSRRFENALSLACSIGQRYAESGYQLLFRDLDGSPLVGGDSLQLSEHAARSSFEDFHLASAELGPLPSATGQRPVQDLIGTNLHRELLSLREEPVIMILGHVSPDQAAVLAALSRTVRDVELFLLAAHPERHAQVQQLLARTGWNIHVLHGNGSLDDARGLS
ncbi:DUF58 domain-containing protein [Glutamicibacter protophormiae]|uniref:DUF58 domain-containing protein n=1 Tax=Glutamicibacter protophormiae TaxID=37930 RepID=A0ABS4XQC2_GLUPR|nr:DUF58 domain-containing protein [Glutamicibacter protophormiae]MBP2398709.1 hypothetical protein [Glutamicibacter protophormiae]GGL81796.1 hypothetical protein GCM10010038_09760 [Glutamicibacter protophormiae]